MASSSRSFLVWIITAAAAVLLVGGFEMARSSDSGRPLRSEHAQTSNDVPSGMMVVVAGNGKLFHIAGCSFIHEKTRLRTISARDASQAGYTPCVRCLGRYLQMALTYSDHSKESAEDLTLK